MFKWKKFGLLAFALVSQLVAISQATAKAATTEDGLMRSEGKIYVVSLSGKVSVLKAGAELEILAVNDLHEECYASPALGPGEIYIRTQKTLYTFRAEGI